MAQVTARKRGKTWEYRFEAASIDGKRKQKSKGGFRTKAEAIKAGTAALTEYNQTGQTVKADTQISVQDFFMQWYDLTKDGRRYSTNVSYLNMMENHIFPALGGYRLASVDHATIQAFINENCRIYSKATVRVMKNVVLQGFSYACTEMGIIASNPALNVKITDNKEKGDKRVRAYEVDEIMQVADLLKGTQAWYAIMLASYTGLRMGEVCALTWDDVDLDAQTIHVHATQTSRNKDGSGGTCGVIGEQKTECGNRIINYGEGLAKILHRLKIEQAENALLYGEYYQRNYLGENGRIHYTTGFVENEMRFLMRWENGKHYNSRQIYRNIREVTNKQFKFHNIRHTQATVLIESGVPLKEVQYRMGHADIKTTLNEYAEATQRTHDESVRALEKAWTNRGQNKESTAKNG